MSRCLQGHHILIQVAFHTPCTEVQAYFLTAEISSYTYILAGQDSEVGIATHYGLDGPGLIPRRDKFSKPVHAPIQWIPRYLQG